MKLTQVRSQQSNFTSVAAIHYIAITSFLVWIFKYKNIIFGLQYLFCWIEKYFFYENIFIKKFENLSSPMLLFQEAMSFLKTFLIHVVNTVII